MAVRTLLSIVLLLGIAGLSSSVDAACLPTLSDCTTGECCETAAFRHGVLRTTFVYAAGVPQCCIVGPFVVPRCAASQIASDLGGAAVCKGGSNGDPMMKGFDGSTFLFNGQAFSAYNMITERDHQLNAWLMPASMFDHNGTYITSFGLQFQNQQILVLVAEDGHLQVFINGKPFVAEHVDDVAHASLQNADGSSLTVTLDHFRPIYGNVFEFSSGFMSGKIWAVAPGSIDEGGKVQPAYLDSQFMITSPPADGQIAGILGDTYRGTGEMGQAIVAQTEKEATYLVQGLFDNEFAANLFKPPSRISRALLESSDPDLQPHGPWVGVFPSEESSTGFVDSSNQPVFLELVPM